MTTGAIPEFGRRSHLRERAFALDQSDHPEDEAEANLDAFWQFARTSGQLDEEFLDKMDLARAEDELQAAVARRRPTLEQLGRLLDRHIDQVDQLLSVRRLEALAAMEDAGNSPEHLDDAAWLPAERSPALVDLQQLTDSGWDSTLLRDDDHDDCDRVVRTARRLIESTVDHLRAIAVLCTDGRPVRSPLALARVASDAAAHVHHLLDPTANAQSRLLRALNEDLVVLSEAVRDSERAGDGRPTDDELAIDALLAEVKRVAPTIHATWPAKDRPRGAKLGRVPFVDRFVGTAKMIDDALDLTGGQVWAVMSKVVHNQESQIFRVMYSLELSKNVRYRAKNISAQVLLTLVVFDRALRRLGPYMGWDLTDLHDNDLLTAWAIGAGLADGQIRAEVLREREEGQ